MKQNATGKRIITSIVVVCVGVLLATAVHAQSGFRGLDGPRGGPRGMPGLRDVDLSDTQHDTIRGIVEQNRETGQAMAEQVGTARMALNEAVLSESFNESNVRTLAGQLAALRGRRSGPTRIRELTGLASLDVRSERRAARAAG